jgi:hypothetical protein
MFGSSSSKTERFTSSTDDTTPASASSTKDSYTSKQPTWLNEKSRPTVAGTPLWTSSPRPAFTHTSPTLLSHGFTSSVTDTPTRGNENKKMENIPPPSIPAASHIQNKLQPPTSPAPKVEMTDAESTSLLTPPNSPPVHGAPNNHADGTRRFDLKSDRPTIKPVTYANRKHSNYQKPDVSPEIEIEADDGTLPEGYIGTHNGARVYIPPFNPDHCGVSGYHKLICGHWIDDGMITLDPVRKPCGLNCHKPSFDAPAFNCPQCYKAITDIIDNKLNKTEKLKLDAAKKAQDATFILAYTIEFATKYSPTKINITETILSITNPGHGRACTETTSPHTYMSVKEMAEKLHAMHARDDFIAHNKLNNGSKRKDAPIVSITVEKPNINTTPPSPTKRQKTKFKTCREPITPSTRGTKRTSTAPTFDDVFRPKRVALAPPVQYGEPSWASPSPEVVGPILRKRQTTIETEIIDRHNRQRRLGCVASDANQVPRWSEGVVGGKWRSVVREGCFSGSLWDVEDEEL